MSDYEVDHDNSGGLIDMSDFRLDNNPIFGTIFKLDWGYDTPTQSISASGDNLFAEVGKITVKYFEEDFTTQTRIRKCRTSRCPGIRRECHCPDHRLRCRSRLCRGRDVCELVSWFKDCCDILFYTPIFNRYRRGLETCPHAKTSRSGHAIFFSFSDASERRV